MFLLIIILFSFDRVAKLHHGHLSHADGNGDWVLTIFTALSLVSNIYIRFVGFLSICFFCCTHNDFITALI